MKTDEEGELRASHSRRKISRLILKLWGRKDEQAMGHRGAKQGPRMLSVAEARQNLEMTLKRTKEECFRAARECALEGLEGFKKMDAFVRGQYADEPQKMAEWEEIAQKYESSDKEDLEPCTECGGAGKCNLCSGTGVDTGVALLTGYEGDCKGCNGTGACPACNRNRSTSYR